MVKTTPASMMYSDNAMSDDELHVQTHVGYIAYLLPANEGEFATPPPRERLFVPRIATGSASDPQASPICFVEVDPDSAPAGPFAPGAGITSASDNPLPDDVIDALAAGNVLGAFGSQGLVPAARVARQTGIAMAPASAADTLIETIRAISGDLARVFPRPAAR